ncbi:MAG: PepSY domain-containing protein [Roseibium sp.]|nr:PepSY domain-containing protein [Roseibium sp.]
MKISTKPKIVVIFFVSLFAPASVHAAGTTPPGTSLTVDQAIAIALEAQPGTIAEAEPDEFAGRPVFDIEVVNTAGKEIEFKVDRQSGEILNKWTDDNPADDPVSGIDADG